MIDLVELSKQVQQFGCSIVREERAFVLSSITGATYRLLCASGTSLQANRVWPSGFSYWIHEGQGLAFVGLWNGLLYQIQKLDEIVALCRDLCSGGGQPESGPLVELPRNVAEAYRVQQVEVLVLAGIDTDSLEDAMNSERRFPYSEQEFVQQVEQEVDSLLKDSTGCIHLTADDCHAFTRFLGTVDGQATLSVVFAGGLRETIGQHRLLVALKRAFALPMFDAAWGNRIDLADPYYGTPHSGARPSHPMNAWSE